MAKKKKHDNKKESEHKKSAEKEWKDEKVKKDVEKEASTTKDHNTSSDEKSHKDDTHSSCDTLRKKNKTLLALLILCAGIAGGSLFVDVAQLFSQKGFSARALHDAQVVEYNGETWVKYDDPKVIVEVFDAPDCDTCVTDDVLVRLRSLMPTLEAHRIDINTPEGKTYAQKYNIKHIPAFLFDQNVTETDFYQRAAILFDDHGTQKQYFDVTSVGVPIGRYLDVPQHTNMTVDDHNDATVQIILFDNPFSQESHVMHPIVKKLRTEYGDKLHMSVTLVPDTDTEQSVQLARALYCAHAQEKFDTYTQQVYRNYKTFTKTKDAQKALRTYAANSKMDVDQFTQCAESDETKNAITQNIAHAKQFGVVASPTFFINDTPHVGVMTYKGLKEQIDAIVQPSEEK